MPRHSKDNHDDPGRAVAALTWLGGGTVGDLEGRSTAPLIGGLVLLGGLLAWPVAAGATAAATGWPVAVAAGVTVVFALLVVTAIRSTVSSTRGLAVRVAVAAVVGVLVGELCSMLLFGTSISERLHQQAIAHSTVAPSAAADLDAQRATRKGLDDAVESARQRRDAAQVVARCEYQPAPSCPQQDITGVAGDGKITENTQQVLDQNQHELDAALGARDQQAPALDARIADAEHSITAARQASVAGSDRGFGARWVAMNGYTFSTPVALVLRVLVTFCCILLYLLPLLLHTRQDRTLRERHEQSRLRAELEAETAIAVKRAEVRAAAEILQAEHQLANMRMALEAETAINREYQRQRMADAAGAEPAALAAQVNHVAPQPLEPAAPVTALPAAPAEPADVEEPRVAAELATIDPQPALPAKTGGLPAIPALPDIAGAAVRFLRPLVPPVITQVVENSTQQLRSAQKVIEEFEEFSFSFKRTTRVTVQDSEQQSSTGTPPAVDTPQALGPLGQQPGWAVSHRLAEPPTIIEHTALDSRDTTALDGRDSTALDSADAPRQLKEGRRALEQ